MLNRCIYFSIFWFSSYMSLLNMNPIRLLSLLVTLIYSYSLFSVIGLPCYLQSDFDYLLGMFWFVTKMGFQLLSHFHRKSMFFFIPITTKHIYTHVTIIILYINDMRLVIAFSIQTHVIIVLLHINYMRLIKAFNIYIDSSFF